MERVNKIWNHPLYQEQFRLIQRSEKDRVFCNHTLEHFLDVARLSWIYNLEEGSGIEKELIYAAALLHDIGRYRQLAEGIPHQQAGAALAGIILPQCGFSREETAEIISAIREHRTAPSTQTFSGSSGKTDDSPGKTTDSSGKTTDSSGKTDVSSGKLAAYLYRADKQSRCCFACPSRTACNWNEEKKNLTIKL